MMTPSHPARVLVLGSGARAARLYEAWRQIGPLHWNLVGFVGTPDGRHVAPVLGPPARLAELIRENEVTDLVVALDDGVAEAWAGAILGALDLGVKVRPMISSFEELTGRAAEAHSREAWESLLGARARGGLFPIAKRLIDLCVGLAGIILFGVLLIPIAAAIQLESRGPLFRRDELAGKYGRRFRKIRFRTERVDVHGERQPGSLPVGADRSTGVGRRLRRFGLHRLPVFVNLLRGDMSLVGPRAENAEAVERLAREIPCSAGRLLARPGLLGWAQLESRRDIRFGADPMRRVEYDLYYIRHASLRLDLRIILESAAAALELLRFR